MEREEMSRQEKEIKRVANGTDTVSWSDGDAAEAVAAEAAATYEYETAPPIGSVNEFSIRKTSSQTDSRTSPEEQPRYLYRILKRGFDIVASLCALIVLFLPLLVISIAVRLTSKGPIFYWDGRVGLGGKDIRVLKYRTMYEDAEEHVRDYLTEEQYQEWLIERKVENDPRITPIGKFLRHTSIDELPQLVNILKGDISIVGPRPLSRTEIETNFTPEERKLLLNCKPGLTGNWAVHGRSDVTFESGERQKLELEYARNCGMWMDLKLIFGTVWTVIRGEGAK